jgi:hypothetical protein
MTCALRLPIIETVPWNETMKVNYLDRDKRFQCKTMGKINKANLILNEYAKQGFIMTVRQLYYQFVARGWIENTFNNYKRLSVIIDDARVAGLIDWDLIEDRTRSLRTYSSWDSPEDIISSAANSYREDIWQGQRCRPEVWIEKNALIGVIKGICNKYRVPHFATIGNNSQSDMRGAGERFSDYLNQGLDPVVLHLADHDPNGIDMTRDIRVRLSMFAGSNIEVRRIALNMDQVEQYKPPPNFIKESDNHSAGYRQTFGTDECWELDALAPPVIAGLIRDELDDMIDVEQWEERKAAEQRNRDLLAKVSENWPRVKKEIGA